MVKKEVITTLAEDFAELGMKLTEAEGDAADEKKKEKGVDPPEEERKKAEDAEKEKATKAPDVKRIEELRKVLGEKILKEKKRTAGRRLAKKVFRKRKVVKESAHQPAKVIRVKHHQSEGHGKIKESLAEATEALEKMEIILGVIEKKIPVLQEDKDTVVLEYAKYLNETATTLHEEVGTLSQDLAKIRVASLRDADVKQIEETVFSLADDLYDILESYADVTEITTKKLDPAAAPAK